MGEKSERNKSTDELRTKIARSRERVDCDLRGLHYELDFPAKLHRSFRERTVSWLAAAAAVVMKSRRSRPGILGIIRLCRCAAHRPENLGQGLRLLSCTKLRTTPS